MNRTEMRGVARDIANEIVIALERAGFKEAAKYVDSKEIREHIRKTADDMVEYY